MSEIPFFSIILPTYNRANILPKSIKSILAQTYSSWELIVVDDGSIDNTKEVVNGFPDSRINYLYQENAERSVARNNGLKNARGSYICFLDSDDCYDPNHLAGLLSSIEKYNTKLEYIYVTKSVSILENDNNPHKLELKIGETDQETVLLNSITPGQLCVPKMFFEGCLFNPKIRISEDTELLIRLIKVGKLMVLDQYTLMYYLHEDNSVNIKKYNAFFERKKTLELIFTYPESSSVSRQLKRLLLSNCYFGIMKYYIAQQKYFKARLTILESIIKYPEIRLKEKVYLLIKKNH